MFNSIFNSFGRTLGRILCYIFIGFLLFVILSTMKGEFDLWKIIENTFSTFL